MYKRNENSVSDITVMNQVETSKTSACILNVVEGSKTSGIVIQLLLLINVNKLVKTQKQRELLMVSGHHKRMDGNKSQ